MKNNLIKRIISGLVFLLIFMAGVIFHPYIFCIVFQVFMIISIWEFFNMTKKEGIHPQRILAIIISSLLFLYFFLILMGINVYKTAIIMPAALLIPMIIELFRKKEKPIQNLASTFLSIIYIGLPFSLLNFLVFDNQQYDYKLITGLSVLIWSYDIGAYFFGSWFGKHKLFKRISPKKSWEGFAGGLIITVVMSVGINYIFETVSLLNWIVLSVIVSIFATIGDLVESMYKRSIDIKDSGNIMPGHGGILDRIDSSLFVVPFALIYLKLIV